MKKKYYLSTIYKNTEVEFLRNCRDRFIKFKNINFKNIQEITLIAIDQPKIKDLFLPFKEKILYRLEYNPVRNFPQSIYLYNFFFDTIYEWDSNYLKKSISYLPFFPSRMGLSENEGIAEEITPINWYYENNFLDKKSQLISTVTSSKAKLEWQKQRLILLDYLKINIKEIDHFGRGINPIKDKARALIKYKYHIAIENSNLGPSEKLWDALLCNCIVFYGGDTSLLMPEIKKAIIEIPIFNLKKASNIIQSELSNSKVFKSLSKTDWEKIKERIKLNYSFSNRLEIT